jgi:hypothetical protein
MFRFLIQYHLPGLMQINEPRGVSVPNECRRARRRQGNSRARPHEPAGFLLSSFTQNLLPDGWTVQVDTLLDPTDGIFTTAIPLLSHLFRASDPTFRRIVQADPGNGFYSVTERFTITASGGVDQLILKVRPQIAQRPPDNRRYCSQLSRRATSSQHPLRSRRSASGAIAKGARVVPRHAAGQGLRPDAGESGTSGHQPSWWLM